LKINSGFSFIEANNLGHIQGAIIMTDKEGQLAKMSLFAIFILEE